MQMNTFVGRLADTPTLRGNGDKAVCRITLIENAYAGKNEDGSARQRVVSVPFVAFRGRAERLSKSCRKGDQLIVEWTLRNNNYEGKDGDTVYGYDFVVEDFEYGAPGQIKRAELAERRDSE